MGRALQFITNRTVRDAKYDNGTSVAYSSKCNRRVHSQCRGKLRAKYGLTPECQCPCHKKGNK